MKFINKSINNLKNLNFLKMNYEIIEGKTLDKIINITVEEKATGEITAGAGVHRAPLLLLE